MSPSKSKNKSKNKHLHRFRKVNIGRNGKEYWVYQCSKPECSYYIAIHLAKDKLCECNRCGNPMTLGKIQLTGSGRGPMTKPHCNDCVERKQDDNTIMAIGDYLNQIPDETTEVDTEEDAEMDTEVDTESYE